MHLNFFVLFLSSTVTEYFCSETSLNKRGDAIVADGGEVPRCIYLGSLSDLRHRRGRPANEEAISTPGLRVGARQARYLPTKVSIQSSTRHHSLVFSTGALVRPSPASSRTVTWWSQWEMINEGSGCQTEEQKMVNYPTTARWGFLLSAASFCLLCVCCRPSEWRQGAPQRLVL